jgi:hypothetical protein
LEVAIDEALTAGYRHFDTAFVSNYALQLILNSKFSIVCILIFKKINYSSTRLKTFSDAALRNGLLLGRESERIFSFVPR